MLANCQYIFNFYWQFKKIFFPLFVLKHMMNVVNNCFYGVLDKFDYMTNLILFAAMINIILYCRHNKNIWHLSIFCNGDEISLMIWPVPWVIAIFDYFMNRFLRILNLSFWYMFWIISYDCHTLFSPHHKKEHQTLYCQIFSLQLSISV